MTSGGGLAVAMAIGAMAALAPASQGGAADATATCRVYATDVVSTSSGGPGVVVLTAKGTFDPATRTTTLDVTVDQSTGRDFTYKQLTTYASVAAVVDEIRVLPPLTLSAGSRAQGGMAFVLTNDYDGQKRLTRTVNNTGGATITTSYTAWENGNTVRIVQRYGSQVVTTTTKINATARICKPA